MVKQVVTNGSNDVRRTNNAPLGTGFSAVGGKDIFLAVVEVCFRSDSGVGLKRRAGGRANMESVLFGTGLQEKSLGLEFGFLESPNKILEEITWDISPWVALTPTTWEELTIDPSQLIGI